MPDCDIYPLSEKAVVISFGDAISLQLHQLVMGAAQVITPHNFPGFIEAVPSYNSLTIYYDPVIWWQKEVDHQKSCFDHVREHLLNLLNQPFSAVTTQRPLHHVPVCYGGTFGPDLAEVSAELGLSEREIIDLHCQIKYTIFMLGFVPGFAYMGELSPLLSISRKPSPRAKVPGGSVGIAGQQTGIYPLDVPGGWRLIGQTPIPLFNPYRAQPTLFSAGDEVLFHAISEEEFHHLKKSTP